MSMHVETITCTLPASGCLSQKGYATFLHNEASQPLGTGWSQYRLPLPDPAGFLLWKQEVSVSASLFHAVH